MLFLDFATSFSIIELIFRKIVTREISHDLLTHYLYFKMLRTMSSFCAGAKFWFSSICAEVIAIVYNIPQVNPLDPEAFEYHCSYAWYVSIDDWCHSLTHRLRKLKIIFRLQSAHLPSFRKQILYCTDQYSASYVWHQTHKSKYDTRCAL